MSYFAAKPTKDFLSDVKRKISGFYESKQRNNEIKNWERSFDLYFGRHIDDGDNTEVRVTGDSGELTAYGINYYRNLVKHVLALTCSQKPSYDYRAKNTDLKSLQQARLANNVIDGYLVEKRMFRHMKQAAERSLVLKSAYVYQTWDPALGKPIRPVPVMDANGQPLYKNGAPVEKMQYEGDAEMCAKSPWDVIHDAYLTEWTKNKWVVVREQENKYDLMARHPEKAEQIEKLSSTYDIQEYGFAKCFHKQFSAKDESELIPVFHFYHLPTEAVPSGRYVKFLNAEIDLYDGPYQYTNKAGNHKLPVHRIAPGEIFDSVDAYSEFYDVMVLQQVYNIISSTILSNQSAFGVQAIWLPDTCNLSAEQIQGMAVLKGGPPGSEPKAIQLTATPMEMFKNGEVVKAAMKELAGLNSAITGDVEQKDMSGVALGRLQAMAIQFSSNFQQSWAELQEDSGTFLLQMLQSFAKTKRITALAGKMNRGALKAWTGADIDEIDRLVCDLGNPLSRTYAGRMDMADKFLDKGLIKDPTKYIELVETGNIEPMFEAPLSKLSLIRKENEMLLDGKAVKALVGDSHIQHSQEHRVILDDPEIRIAADNGDQLAATILKNTLNHILEHENFHNTQDPFWFVVSGEPPPMPPPLPPPGANDGGQPPPEAGAGPQALPPPPMNSENPLPPMPMVPPEVA